MLIQPTIQPQQKRIAIISDDPLGTSSISCLKKLLSKANVIYDSCLIADLKELDLQNAITNYNPNICLLLGGDTLEAAKGHDASISSWRGSFFSGTGPIFSNRKCLASYTPDACFVVYDYMPLLAFDIRKAANDSSSPTLPTPHRSLLTTLTYDETLNELDKVILEKPTISIDIEGGIGTMSCLSIATSLDKAFIVPFASLDKGSYWQDPEQEFQIWRRLIAILTNPQIKKILQNCLYDRFVLQYSYQLCVDGTVDDTMLKHHELYSELEKGLGFLCSIYTNEPYYKSDRKTDNAQTFFQYCCRDSAVTYEISNKLSNYLTPLSKTHYQFNLDTLNPLLYMELKGIRYNTDLAQYRLIEANAQRYDLQGQLDRIANLGVPPSTTKDQLHELIRRTMCYKSDATKPLAAFVYCHTRTLAIADKWPNLSDSEYGELNKYLKLGLNIRSKQLKDYLYRDLKLPIQKSTKRIKPSADPLANEDETKEPAETTDYAALLTLAKNSTHPAIRLIIDISAFRTRLQMLEISADSDGRVRCGYNIVGTETCRLTCYTSPTGSGYNLQTIPAENTLRPVGHPLRLGMRDLFRADDGYYLFQCDLSGADGWTVAAYLAYLGDRTMLDDYRAGIKPARVLCYLMRHGAASLSGKSRDEIKQLTKSVEKDSWDYFASKIGQHGTCYLMGKRLLARMVFVQSEGLVSITEKQAEDLQRLFMVRYNVKLWHNWMTRHLDRQPYPPSLTTASGHTRKFFGRHTEILGQALAHEPQVNTTYATNLAAYRLWTDPENRILQNDGPTAQRTILHIQPLHQVHDALLGQFRIEDTAWAVNKIKSYFNNPLVIAGQQITIPFEGAYGTNWALDHESKIGDIG